MLCDETNHARVWGEVLRVTVQHTPAEVHHAVHRFLMEMLI